MLVGNKSKMAEEAVVEGDEFGVWLIVRDNMQYVTPN